MDNDEWSNRELWESINSNPSRGERIDVIEDIERRFNRERCRIQRLFAIKRNGLKDVARREISKIYQQYKGNPKLREHIIEQLRLKGLEWLRKTYSESQLALMSSRTNERISVMHALNRIYNIGIPDNVIDENPDSAVKIMRIFFQRRRDNEKSD